MSDASSPTPSWSKFADCEGPSAEEERAAFARRNRLNRIKRDADSGIQGGGGLMFGTPRKGKHPHSHVVGGVRVK